MGMITSLLKLGTIFAAGRLSRSVSADDVRRMTHAAADLHADDIRRYAWGATDDLLLRAGLQRVSTVPSSTLLVLGGVGAGAILGVGVMAFFDHTEMGKEFRGKIISAMSKAVGEEKAEETPEKPVTATEESAGGNAAEPVVHA